MAVKRKTKKKEKTGEEVNSKERSGVSHPANNKGKQSELLPRASWSEGFVEEKKEKKGMKRGI